MNKKLNVSKLWNEELVFEVPFLFSPQAFFDLAFGTNTGIQNKWNFGERK